MTLIEVDLTALAYGGEAIGRMDDGRAVFVPFALPGERVRARIVEQKRGFARAALVEVLRPSAERIQPRCAHFGDCGGCHYQHIPYETQLQAKAAILLDQFARIGKISDPPLRPIIPAPQAWNYRNHVQFHLDDEGRLGFQSASGGGVLPVHECHLPAEAIDPAWRDLSFDPGSGIERVGLRTGDGDELMLVLESDDDPPEMESEAGLSIVHLSGEHAVVMAGSDHLVISVHGRPFRVSAGAFFQVHTAMADALVAHVLTLAPEKMGTVLDVYCGVGLFSAFLAARCDRLIGIEAGEVAGDDFAVNLDEFEHVELYQAPAEAVLPGLEAHPDLALVVPPRAGLDRAVIDALARLGPARLVYVSCDPSTLARDAARLIAHGYHLEQVTPFDLFPQTYHIESVSLFTRPRGA